MVEVHGDTSDDNAESSRRAEPGGGQDKAGSCRKATQSKKELAGTALTCGLCLAATILFRVLIVRTIEYIRARNGHEGSGKSLNGFFYERWNVRG